MARRAVLRRSVSAILAALLVAAPLVVQAQPPGKIPRIGILRQGSPPDPLVEAFRQGLRELGYVEGQNISIEYRWAEGDVERLPDLAGDLVRLKVDVIVASGVEARVAKNATGAIPIVMPVSTDPVRAGLIASLSRPGGNVTGLGSLFEEMPGKWMELLREAVPGVSRLAILRDPGTDRGRGQLTASAAAARSLNVRLEVLNASRPGELAMAFAEAERNRAGALIVLPSAFLFGYRARVVELAARHRLPAMYVQREFVVGAGGLISYGPDLDDMFRRAAGYVDRILKGARPADLPIEQPTKFELVINLNTARALNLTIPQSLRARADQLIQ